MNRSENIAKLALALNNAQKKIGAAKKDSNNPFFKSKYADLAAVMEACKDALNSEGISVLQPVTYTADGKHAVETILLHSSGEFISNSMALELKNITMQDLGSAISYARRYGLKSMVFIPDSDDDAETTMGRAKPAAANVTSEAKQEASPASPPAKSAPAATSTTSTFRKPAKAAAPVVSKPAPASDEEWA